MQDMKEISNMFKELRLSEMTVKDGDFEISLKKAEPEETGVMKKVTTSSDSEGGVPVQTAVPEEKKEIIDGIPVTAPLPGIFYAGDSEGGKPYVKVGDTVDPENVVCSIEAMKMLNHVKAGSAGKVKKICASDGDMVGFGQVLFVLEEA
jgi:acetyl-CoA carboxylase biotin carboxyl carrier protein